MSTDTNPTDPRSQLVAECVPAVQAAMQAQPHLMQAAGPFGLSVGSLSTDAIAALTNRFFDIAARWAGKPVEVFVASEKANIRKWIPQDVLDVASDIIKSLNDNPPPGVL